MIGGIRLEDVAREIGEPISRDGAKREVVFKELDSGNRIEIRRLYLFDDRGIVVELFQRGRSRPHLSAKAFAERRFRYLVNLFAYLGERQMTMNSEISLDRAVDRYNRKRGQLA
jgi:hypothetical protein